MTFPSTLDVFATFLTPHAAYAPTELTGDFAHIYFWVATPIQHARSVEAQGGILLLGLEVLANELADALLLVHSAEEGASAQRMVPSAAARTSSFGASRVPHGRGHGPAAISANPFTGG